MRKIKYIAIKFRGAILLAVAAFIASALGACRTTKPDEEPQPLYGVSSSYERVESDAQSTSQQVSSLNNS